MANLGFDILGEFGVVQGFMEASLKQDIQYLLTRDLNALHQAVCYAQKAVHVARERVNLLLRDAPMLVYLGRTYLRRFQHRKEVEDLIAAIEVFQHALKLFTGDSPFRRKCSDYLRISCFVRDGNLDELQELNFPHACNESRPSLDTYIHDWDEDDEVYEYFESTTEDIERRYYSEMVMKDPDSGIRLSRLALGFFSYNSGRRARIQITLASFLISRFESQNRLQDINDAVQCCDHGLESELPDFLKFRKGLSIASRAHIKRFEYLRRQEDLNDGVRLAKEAVELVEMHDPDFARDANFAFCLDPLADALRCRFSINGRVNDLSDAIGASSRAFDIGRDGIYLPELLSILRDCLISRYERNRRGEDLSEIMDIARRVVKCWLANHPQRVMALLQLAYAELLQSQVLQDPECRKRAAQHMNEARGILKVIPELRQKLQPKLDEVASRLVSSDSPSKLSKVDQEIEIARTVAASATHHAEVFYSHSFLCLCLSRRWELTRDIKDFDEVISLARSLMTNSAEKTEDKAPLVLGWSNLGVFLYHRFKGSGDQKNSEPLALLLEGFRMSGSPLLRMVLGQAAVDMLANMAEWKRAHNLCREIIDLFVILNGRSQPWPDKEYLLRNFFSYGVANFASIALEAGSSVLDVLDMLETCRGSILGHLIDRQADLGELMAVHPEKATCLKRWQDEINVVVDPSANTNIRVEQASRRMEAEAKIQARLGEIRMLEGFDRFLVGPTERELKAAAARGPILIVNVSGVRSDAIIITKDAFHLMPLPGLKCEKVQAYIDVKIAKIWDDGIVQIRKIDLLLRKLLGWLWDECVKLIFEKLLDLGYGPAKFHVWWIGVGVANSLPFHAAGKHVGRVHDSALFRAISSYTPTLKVLLHGQRKLRDVPRELDLQRLTIVAMPSTPGMADLDAVQIEAQKIHQIGGDAFSTQMLVQPSAREAMAQMAESEIVHFACHATSIHLFLQATAPNSTVPEINLLRLRDVANAHLGHGKLAFLSACSTAQNKDTQLWDEGLHLVSAFQVAGYLHAIGSLWLLDDQMSLEVVERFYEHLVAAGEFGNGRNVAEALNKSLIDVAKAYPRQPFAWAQFVHFGV